jgi:hypothetical protein
MSNSVPTNSRYVSLAFFLVGFVLGLLFVSLLYRYFVGDAEVHPDSDLNFAAIAMAVAFGVLGLLIRRRLSRWFGPNKSLHPTAATSSVMESQSGGG